MSAGTRKQLFRLAASLGRARYRARPRLVAKWGTWFLAAGAVLALASSARAQGQRPARAPEARIDQRLGEQVPLDVVLRDESGRAVPLRRYFDGRPVVLVLAYFRCPRLCSVILNNLTESLRKVPYKIGKKFTVLTVSFDPREKPDLAAAKKAAYAESYGLPGAEKGWHFLTGEGPQIKRLADAVGFRYFYDDKKGEYAHASGIMVLTPDGKVSRYFYGIDFPPRDLAFGLEDASSGAIGSPVVRPLRLLCYGYDPVTGKYTLLTMRLVRLAGLLTVLVVASALWFAWRRERRRHSPLSPPAGGGNDLPGTTAQP
jgi:protein SCO1/2